jgi:hypothetical protein
MYRKFGPKWTEALEPMGSLSGLVDDLSYGLGEHSDVEPFLFKSAFRTRKPQAKYRARRTQAAQEHALASRIVARLKELGL